MKRLNQQHNSPEVFNKKFNGTLAVSDMERLELLAKHFDGGTYVDVGCLDSPMPVILSERYPDSDIWGVDYADDVISFLAPRFPGVGYIVADCYKLPFPDNSVDCLVAGEVIEHLEEPQRAVDEWLRVLKPGGYLSISTPWQELNGQESVGGHLHIWSFTEQDIQELLGTKDTMIHSDERTKSILAWRQK